MDTPITTRIAHNRGDHHGEEETYASTGCSACYRLVALGLDAPAPAQAGPRWLQRANLKDFTAFVPSETN